MQAVWGGVLSLMLGGACVLNALVLTPRARLPWLTGAVAASAGAVLAAALLWGLAIPAPAPRASALGAWGLACPATLSCEFSFGGNWHEAVLAAGIMPACVFSVLLLDKPQARTLGAYAALALALAAGLGMALANALALLLLCFELLLLTSLFLLLATSKADRIGQAVSEMFLWTLAGSLGLLVAISALAAQGVSTLSALAASAAVDPLVSFLLLAGFSVKLPVWPCYSWLLRAHVEASVEFSILLSGVIVKFGALGLFRVLQAQPAGPAVHLLAATCLIAMVEATLRILAQRDLKRVVALTTVIEMNWLGFCLSSGGAAMERVAALLLVAHSFATTGEFYLVETIYRRFHTRDLTQLAGLYAQAPVLWALSLLTVLTSIGFPATSIFAAKVAFLSACIHGPLVIFTAFLLGLMLALPLLFVRLWAPLWFGAGWPHARTGAVIDLTGKEVAILGLSALGSLLLGLCPQALLGAA